MYRKTIIITGAANGIGQALVSKHLKEGARVIAIDSHFNDKPIMKDLLYIERDIRDLNESDLLEFIPQGGVDNVILCAGVSEVGREKNEVMDINATGTVRSYDVLKSFVKENGRIVLVSSDLITMNEEMSVYARSKLAAAKLIHDKAMQNDSPSTLIVLPGPVDTELFREGKPDEVIERIRKDVGIYSPEDFAENFFRYMHMDWGNGIFIRMYEKAGITLVLMLEFLNKELVLA